MNDESRLVAGAAVGAVLGGLAAYLVLTDQGRQVRAQVHTTLTELSELLQELRRALREAQRARGKARSVAKDVRSTVAGGDLPADAGI